MKVLHSWLKEYVGDRIPTPVEVEELLTFHAFEIEGVEKVGDETVLDVDVLPNRASDCLSHRGIARELASLLGTSLKSDPLLEQPELTPTNKVAVSIDDTEACRRFGIVFVTGVKVKESPKWLRERLEALGQRSINNVVDATNYVMLALGQPIHAYDADKFEKDGGRWHVGVRFARGDEMITTLTGEEYELDGTVQLIVNAANDTPAGIAGIKGGKYAEVDESTTALLIEAANFDPVVTRRASQFLRLQTDASKRFENQPSRELIPHALDAVAKLITELAGGSTEGFLDEYPTREKQVSVPLGIERTSELLGLSLTRDEIASILDRIGGMYQDTGDGFSVTGPWERSDLTIEEDFVEEVGRIHGYSHIASVVPTSVALAEINKRQYYSDVIRKLLIEAGFSEVITSSFRKKDAVRLRNALASDKGCLRSDLSQNIREVLDRNISFVDLLGLQDIRVFEIGTVFDKTANGVGEHISLALGIRTKKQEYTPKDDKALEGVVTKLQEVLGADIDVLIDEGAAELNFSELLEKLPEPTAYQSHEVGEDVQYAPFSPYPHVSRDIALWVEEGVNADAVEHVLNTAAGELRVRTTLFDEFEKSGRISYAFRLVFQSHKKTLTDSEVNPIMDKIYHAVSEQGWDVR